MKNIQYKGYEIEAHTQQQRQTGQWRCFGVIFLHKGSRTVNWEGPYGADFKTEEQAIQDCFNRCKQIIDADSNLLK